MNQNAPSFAPQMPQGPSGNMGGGDTASNLNNRPRSGESQESIRQSVQRSKSVGQALHTVITSREELEKYLAQYNLQVLTSATDLDAGMSFIDSSYIRYLEHGNVTEPMSVFLQRYPDYQPIVEKINEEVGVQAGRIGL